jgi:hypothetical protein
MRVRQASQFKIAWCRAGAHDYPRSGPAGLPDGFLGCSVELMIDAHGSLEVATAIKLAKELKPYDIAWFEEPVSPDDHAGQAEVR